MTTDRRHCQLSTIPIRRNPGDAQEMVTELIYGECYTILQQEGKWLEVTSEHDGYTGWMAAEQNLIGSTEVRNNLLQREAWLETDHGRILLSIGSWLTRKEFDSLGMSEKSIRSLSQVARSFLGTSYRWGGRSLHGIDCSGLTQICARTCGIQLPRDAKDQVVMGDLIEYEDLRENDLVFFQNQSGKVTHVGIAMGNSEIIHSSGFVRIDYLSKEGITRKTDDSLSHHFHSIRRIST